MDFVDRAFELRPADWADWPTQLRWYMEERFIDDVVALLRADQTYPLDLGRALEDVTTELNRIPAIGAAASTVDLGRASVDSPDPRYAPEVIEGYLRAGELMNLIAAPKIGKSWVALALAVAVTAGRKWCGRGVKQGRVLLIDGELSREVLMARAAKVMAAMGVAPADVAGRLDVVVARGEKLGVREVTRLAASGTYDIVLLDPLYRLLADGQTEIDDAAMRELYDGLLRVTTRTGCADGGRAPPAQGRRLEAVDGRQRRGQQRARPQRRHPRRPPVGGRRRQGRRRRHRGRDHPDRHVPDLPAAGPAPAAAAHGDAPILVPAGADGEDCGGFPEGRRLLEAMAFADYCARTDPETKKEILARADDMPASNGKKMSKRHADMVFEKCVTHGFIEKVSAKGGHRYRRAANREEEIGQQMNQNLEQAENAGETSGTEGGAPRP